MKILRYDEYINESVKSEEFVMSFFKYIIQKVDEKYLKNYYDDDYFISDGEIKNENELVNPYRYDIYLDSKIKRVKGIPKEFSDILLHDSTIFVVEFIRTDENYFGVFNHAEKFDINNIGNLKIRLILGTIQDNTDSYSSFISQIHTTLKHEIKHLYDWINSNGRAFYSKQNNQNPLDNDDTYKNYLNFIHEVDARMSEWIAKNDYKFVNRDLSDLISDLKSDPGIKFDYLTKENRKRLIKKITAHINKFKNIDNKTNFGQLEEKLIELNKKYRPENYDFKNWPTAHINNISNKTKGEKVIVIDRLPYVPEKFINEIIRLADIYGFYVAVADGNLYKPTLNLYSDDRENYNNHIEMYNQLDKFFKKDSRFKRNKGSNKLYFLPMATFYYYEPIDKIEKRRILNKKK